MAVCHACSSPVSEGGSFCPRCGVALRDAAKAVDETEALPEAAESSRPPSTAAQSASSAVGLISSSGGRDYAAGTIIAARYRVVGLLGRGGMGEVYRADDLTLGQPVALKFLPAELTDSADRLDRFRAEVRVSRQVSHPNVCRVHDIGEANGRVFLSMELVDGGDLRSLLKRVGRLPPDKGLEIARQLCAGLAAAHDRGVLHRDLKPANVMIDSEGRVRIADFGLAGLSGGFSAGEIRSGTPAYMAPEAASGQEVTGRSDIYALGLVLYELFTGKHPFKGDSAAELAEAHRQETPTSPSEVVPDIDPEIEKVLLQCLEKDPKHRPATALEVSAMLPGGDPLATMLAAGETPSPELVAAAGEEGVLGTGRAWALLAACLACLLFAVGANQQRQLLDLVPMERPPEVQLDRARESLEKLGLEIPTGDVKHGFVLPLRLATEIERDGVSAEERSMLSNGEVDPIRFWMRASPSALVAYLPSGQVSPGFPPLEEPGELFAVFDVSGHLRSLEVVPDELLTGPDRPTETTNQQSWAPLFTAAGLDPNEFREAEPLRSPPQYVDEMLAWTRADKAQELLIDRVEAGRRNGRLVYLRTSAGFETDEAATQAGSRGSAAAQTLSITLLIVVLTGGSLLARRNLRLGRGDARGAIRLAAVISLLTIIGWLVSADHAFDADAEFGLFFLAAGEALFWGAAAWLLYVALEPEVRRHWPRRLISWQRLLAKRYRDPLVGRHVLIGVLLGCIFTALLTVTEIGLWHYSESASSLDYSGVGAITGVGHALSIILANAGQAVFTSLFITVLVLLVRLVLRRTWAAVGLVTIVVAVLSSLNADPLLVYSTLALLAVGTVMFALLRYGLLALVVTIFTLNLQQACAMSLSLSSWYLYATLMPVLSLVLLAYYGFSVSLGRRRQRLEPR